MSQILELLDGKKFKITMINILKVSMENVNNKRLSNVNREIETRNFKYEFLNAS